MTPARALTPVWLAALNERPADSTSIIVVESRVDAVAVCNTAKLAYRGQDADLPKKRIVRALNPRVGSRQIPKPGTCHVCSDLYDAMPGFNLRCIFCAICYIPYAPLKAQARSGQRPRSNIQPLLNSVRFVYRAENIKSKSHRRHIWLATFSQLLQGPSYNHVNVFDAI